MRVLAEASEQIVDSGLGEKLVDQTDESEQVLFEHRWEAAHQGLTGNRQWASDMSQHFPYDGFAENRLKLLQCYAAIYLLTFSVAVFWSQETSRGPGTVL